MADEDEVARGRVRDGVLLARDASADEMRAVRRGERWHRLRRGAYLAPSRQVLAPHDERSRVLAARIRAVHADRTAPGWFSHTSAAVIWGCDLVEVPDDVHLVQRSRPHVHGDPRVVRHHGSVAEVDRAVVSGLPVTGIERTVVDCAVVLPRPQALVVADSALRLRADPGRLDELREERTGHRGIAAIREVLDLADGRSESPGESLLRWHLLAQRLPAPDLQVEIRTRLGVFRVDTAWPAARLAVEFDGFVKYAGGDGRSASRRVFEEKRRQDAIEEEGWRVLRVTWSDLRAPSSLARRVRDALDRGRPPGARLEVVSRGRGRHS